MNKWNEKEKKQFQESREIFLSAFEAYKDDENFKPIVIHVDFKNKIRIEAPNSDKKKVA